MNLIGFLCLCMTQIQGVQRRHTERPEQLEFTAGTSDAMEAAAKQYFEKANEMHEAAQQRIRENSFSPEEFKMNLRASLEQTLPDCLRNDSDLNRIVDDAVAGNYYLLFNKESTCPKLRNLNPLMDKRNVRTPDHDAAEQHLLNFFQSNLLKSIGTMTSAEVRIFFEKITDDADDQDPARRQTLDSFVPSWTGGKVDNYETKRKLINLVTSAVHVKKMSQDQPKAGSIANMNIHQLVRFTDKPTPVHRQTVA